MNKLKNKNGITLVALIITIIVLLILAMVSISLVMNSGIIDKSKTAVDKYSKEEIGEQLKLAYSEYQMSQYTGTPIDIQAKLREIYGNDVTATLANGKLTATIKGKKYDYDIATGTAGEHVYVDPFNYGEGKTKTTVAAGNEITITNGTTTEYFTVISNTNGTILAMPYYNLVTVTADGTVKQGPAVEGTSTAISSSFSTTNYWTQGADAIDMSDSRNKIQTYITAYQTTLEGLGAEGITVRAAKYSELNAEGVTPAMRNPGQTGNFWLGSGNSGNASGVWTVSSGGDIHDRDSYYQQLRGSSSYNYLLI